MYEMSDKKLKELEKEFEEKEIQNIAFKDMGFLDKVRYIWDYYKFHIIGSIAGLAFIIAITTTIFTNLNTVIILDATFMTRDFDFTQTETLEAHWYDLLYQEDFGKRQELVIDFIDIRDDVSPDTKMATQSKFMAKTSTNGFDLFIMEEDFVLENQSTGLLMDLSEIIDVEALGIDEQMLYYVDGQLIGIDVTHQTLIDPTNNTDATIYVGAFYNSLNRDNIKKVLEDMF